MYRGTLLFATLVLLTGCEDRPWAPFSGSGGGGGSSSTATTDGGSGGVTLTTENTGNGPGCDGECHLWKSALFDDLSLFWIGPGEPPPCPGSAPAPGVTLHADLLPSAISCPACSCAPSGCAIPEQMHASAAKCPADGAASIPWDSPGWNGDCITEGAIPSGLLCGGVPCVQSITIDAPSVGSCAPVSQGAESKPDPTWGLTGQECILGPLSGQGCGGSEACVPAPPEGFALCLYRWGDELAADQCPSDYPRFVRMFADHEDTRACEPCSCAAPQGGECAAHVAVFADGLCGMQLAAYTVTSAMDSACVDLPPGAGLGSKQGTLTLDKPGACAPSGGPVGEVTPAMPLSLCCQPDAPPAP